MRESGLPVVELTPRERLSRMPCADPPVFAFRGHLEATRPRGIGPWELAWELADRQDGTVTVHQLQECGISKDTIRRGVAAGRLVRLQLGVYAFGHARLADRAWLRAALLASGERAVLSHLTAAWWWGLVEQAPSRVHVTTATNRRSTFTIDRRKGKVDGDAVRLAGLPVTTIPRTLLDIAGDDDRELARLLREAAYRRRLDRDTVIATLQRARGHRGATRLRAAVERHHPELAYTRTELEARFVDLLHVHELPMAKLNEPVTVGATTYTVDALWPAARLIAELDGWEALGTRDAFEEDRRRDRRLTLADYRVLRFTWREVVHERRAVARALHVALRQAKR